MAECPCLKTCPFFNDKMSKMPSLANMYKKDYCLGDNIECARFIVFKKLGPGKAPSDLFPNQKEKANEFIKSILH